MIPQDNYKIIDKGVGYTIGELTQTPQFFDYMRPKQIVTLFDGLDAALDFVTEKMPEPKYGDSSLATGRDGFNAFANYDEALSTFRNSPEKVVKFDPSELRIKDDIEAGSSVEYDVVGDFIDMGRYMEGIPEAVGTMHNGNARNRRVNITINLNQWAGIDHSVITHRGERILRLIDALEGGGVRCQLTAIESSQCNHTEVVIKKHDEPLTTPDLAVVSHPEFLRRVIFRIIEHSKTFSYNYGYAREFGRAVQAEHIQSDNNDEMNLFIDGNLEYTDEVDRRFDEVEKLLVWEMSKPVPEVNAVKVGQDGVYFNSNGTRSDTEIQREGREAIHAD